MFVDSGYMSENSMKITSNSPFSDYELFGVFLKFVLD